MVKTNGEKWKTYRMKNAEIYGARKQDREVDIGPK